MMSPIPRIVIDTNTIVRGMCRHRHSASWSVLREALSCKLDIVLSLSLFLEYEDVLHRREIAELLSRYETSRKYVDSTLTVLANKAEEVQVRFRWRPNLLDAGDDHVLEAALHGQALLVTCNPSDFVPPRAELLFPELRIMTPVEFVETYLEG